MSTNPFCAIKEKLSVVVNYDDQQEFNWPLTCQFKKSIVEPSALHACQTMGRPNETADGVLGNLLLQLGSTEMTDTYCPKGFIMDVRQASMGATHWYQFLHPPGTACILHQNATVQGWTMDPMISP